MSVAPERLVLGTAQLGMAYGVANAEGMPDAKRARAIVAAAWESGVRAFDTAQVYGQSERVLGEALRDLGLAGAARVLTKLDPGAAHETADDVCRAVEASRNRIGSEKLWGVMLHREEQLRHWAGPLGEGLALAQARGLVEGVGCSVYTAAAAQQAMSIPGLNLVQAPANLFDRRMRSAGVYDIALKTGTDLFLRSVFLQGLVRMPPAQVPATIEHGQEAAEALSAFCASHACDPALLALQYVLRASDRVHLVVGAEHPRQVQENCRQLQAPWLPDELFEAWDRAWPTDYPGLINPTCWTAQATP